MIKLRKILVPMDFSDNSRLALDYALALGEKFESELHLVNILRDILQITAPEPGLVLASTGDLMRELREGAVSEMKKVVDSKALAGKKVVHHVLDGHPFVEIVHYARDKSIDLIVMGTHGRTGLAHLLMGSVAENAVRKASCPVLTVRPTGHQFVMP